MKSTILSLSLLALVACGKKGSSKNPGSVATPIANPGTQIDPNVGEGTDTGSGNSTGPGSGSGTGNGTGTDAGTEPGKSGAAPLVGVYLGACEVVGAESIASGIEITSSHIFPATALFATGDCSKEGLIAWGHTGDYPDFESYAAHIAEKTKALGDEAAASFDDSGIKHVSKSGVTSLLTRSKAILTPEKRLKIFVSKYSFDKTNGLVSGETILTKGPLAEGEFDIGFYCEDANKKIVRQQSSFTSDAKGNATFTGILNTWAPVPAETRCQVTLAVLQNVTGGTRVYNVAWSQFIEVK